MGIVSVGSLTAENKGLRMCRDFCYPWYWVHCGDAAIYLDEWPGFPGYGGGIPGWA
jgi:hypothetical protein